MAATPDGIYRVESDPGEDAYGAPTKVGPMSKAAVAKLMRDADEVRPAPTGPASGLRPRATPPAPAPAAPTANADDELPVLFNDDDEGLEPTRLTSRTQPPSPTTVAVLTRGASSIVADLVAEALDEVDATPPSTREPTPPPAPASPPPSAAPAVVTPQAWSSAPSAPQMPTFAFPHWNAGATNEALARPNAKMSDRALTLAIVASAIGFVMFLVPLIWLLYR